MIVDARATMWTIGLLCLTCALLQRSLLAALVLPGLLFLGALMPSLRVRLRADSFVTSSDRRLLSVILSLPLAVGVGAVNENASALVLIVMALVLCTCVDLRLKQLDLPCLFLMCGTLYLLTVYRTEALSRSAACIVVALLMVGIWRSSITRDKLFGAVMQSIALYLVASVAAYYGLGLRSQAAANRLGGLESSFDFFGTRLFLPFTNSMVVPAVLASAYVCWAAHRLLRREDHSLVTKVGILTASFVLLAANYRVPIAVAFILGVLSLVPARVVRFIAAPLAIALLFVPFWWHEGRNPVRATVDMVKTQTGSLLERKGEVESGDTSTLNNRTPLWRRASSIFGTEDFDERLLGYGVNGHAKSGASLAFYQIFNGHAGNRFGISPHSTAWQTLFDAGLVGLGVLVAMLLSGILSAGRWVDPSRPSRRLGNSPLLALLALAASMGTEVALAPGVGTEAFWVFLLLVAVAVAGRRPGFAEAARSVTETGPVLAASFSGRP